MHKDFLKTMYRTLKRSTDTLQTFNADLKTLSTEDREWYDARLEAEGYYTEAKN